MSDLSEIYLAASRLAAVNKQTVGSKNDYYITLKQLMDIMDNQ